MSEGEDYYSILGVSRDSDPGAIKKAYKELALRWHPDKNADQKQIAEVKFKLIAEAYQTLSDPEKRSVYDRYGKEGLRRTAHQGGFSGVDPTDVGLSAAFESFRKVFEEMYDGNGGFPFGDLFGGGFFGRSTGGGKSQASMDPFSGFFSGGNVFSSSMNMSSFSSGGSGVRSCSRSNQTYTVNGKTVNIVKETDSSGRVKQTVTKFSGPGQIAEKTVEIYGPTGALESRTDLNKDGTPRTLQNRPGGKN